MKASAPPGKIFSIFRSLVETTPNQFVARLMVPNEPLEDGSGLSRGGTSCRGPWISR